MDYTPLELEVPFVILAYADMQQTINIKDHPGLQESNLILGHHPSDRKIRSYFAAVELAHVGITYALPYKYRTPWQTITIAIEVETLYRNKSIGLRVHF